jgi:hypothetical protein
MTRRPVPMLGLLLVCLSALPAYAQDAAPADPPAHVSFVDGSVILERDGRADNDPLSMPLLAGDRIRTQGGRAEILFTDGSTLHLDANTVVDFQSDEVVRLLEGRLRLSIAGPARDVAFRIDAPAAWVQIGNPGEYRLAVLRNGEVELAVLRGAAELVNEQGRSYVGAGERTFARGGAAPSPAYVFNSAAWDNFDRWSESRRDQRLGVSAQYLPEDVRRYAPAFESHGSWRYEQVYGYVWYPRVQTGWRPYQRGRWASLRPYGWTWIAADPWGWPTHHYGRWGMSTAGWFWIPGRSWAPAWVSWAYAPGYVSWCPLGWNDRAVFQLNVNVYGGRRYDPWDAWSVLPRQHFSAAYVNVSRYGSFRVDPRLHRSFVVERHGPDVSFAVNRSAVPIRTAGRYAGARDAGRTFERRADGYDGGRARLSRESSGTADADRRFPAAARTPGARTNPEPARGASRTAEGDRAVSRESRATSPVYQDNPRDSGERTRATQRGAAVGPDYRSSNEQTPRTADAPERAVTPPSYGAVRAAPRQRRTDHGDAAGSPMPAPPQERTRSYSPPSSRYEAPAQPAPAAAAPAYGAAERRAALRNMPDSGYSRDSATRGAPDRGTERPAPRSYGGSAPERQAPQASPRSERPASRASEPRGGEPRGGSGGRERSSEGRSTGQATSRRR